MIKVAGILLLITMVLFASSAAAQLNWQLKVHSMDTATVRNEMQVMVNSGWTPIGLSQYGSSLYVMYLNGDPFNITAWQLKWYHNKAALQNDITSMMNSSYFPLGISYTGDIFFVIYIQPQNSSATAWQLVPAGSTMESVRAAITPYTRQYYLPCGITQYGSQFWTLLVRIPDTTAKSWEIEQYVADNNVVQSNIDNALTNGKVPWGFTNEGNVFTILYVGF